MDWLKNSRFFYGWIVAICCFFSAASYGVFFSLGVFFKPLQAEFGWSAGLISTIHALHLAVFVISMPIIGRLTDKFKAKKIFLISALLIGTGFFFCGTVTKLWHFYLFYLIASLGIGASTALPTSIVQKWFIEKKGLALGIVLAGIGAGPLFAAPLVNFLISNYGWRTSYFVIGILLWILISLVALIIVDRPEDIGLLPLGAEEKNGKLQSDSSIVEAANPPMRAEWSTRDALRTRTFYVMSSIWFLCAMPVHLIMINIVPFAIDLGIAKGVAATGLGLIGGMSILGRLLGGVFSDIIGLKRSLIIAAFFSTAALFWLINVKNTNMFFIFVFIYGFFYGARVPQIPGLIGNYFGNKNLTEIMGIFWAIAGIGGVAGSLVGGFVFDLTGSYTMAFVYAAICFGAAGALTFLLKPPKLQRY